MIDPTEWEEVRSVFRAAFSTDSHFSLASAGADGQPLVTPIGSVMLGAPGRALYFEQFAFGLGERLAADPRVSVLAVDSGRWRWLQALLRGRFARPPAVRLVGTAVRTCRPATDDERRRWHRRVGPLLRTPGGQALWAGMGSVRELSVERVDWIRLGAMTPRER